MSPTPSDNAALARRFGDFATLTEALDYAAQWRDGHQPLFPARRAGRGPDLCAALREQARGLAGRLLASGLQPGDRVALIAETDGDFIRAFFACQYAGPDSRAAAAAGAVRRPGRLCRPDPPHDRERRAPAPRSARRAAGLAGLGGRGPEPAHGRSVSTASPRPAPTSRRCRRSRPRTSATCSSPPAGPASRWGSRSPSGADGQRRGDHPRRPGGPPGRPRRLLAAALPRHGPGRLPAHPAGLPDVARPHAHRRLRAPAAPVAGPDLAGTAAPSPTARPSATSSAPAGPRPRAPTGLDLSGWRVAGIGGDMIRPGVIAAFAERFAPAGFDGRAFVRQLRHGRGDAGPVDGAARRGRPHRAGRHRRAGARPPAQAPAAQQPRARLRPLRPAPARPRPRSARRGRRGAAAGRRSAGSSPAGPA